MTEPPVARTEGTHHGRHPSPPRHLRPAISAPPTAVYEAFATIDGLSSWWTETVTGDPSTGGRLTFSFGAPDRTVVVKVVAAAPDTQVVWRCVNGPSEWVDTTMTFNLDQSGDETVLRFAHAGWREPVEFMGHCTSKWAYFLFGLKASFEGGKATPFPDDEKISNWG